MGYQQEIKKKGTQSNYRKFWSMEYSTYQKKLVNNQNIENFGIWNTGIFQKKVKQRVEV